MTLTLWTARLATLCYVVAVALWLGRRRLTPAMRAWWTAGCVVFVVHVVAAFALVHDWSHTRALAATADQTAAFVGVASGAGLYLNYGFAVVWVGDVVWWQAAPASYAARSAAVASAVHGFMAFMFVNATVVFGTASVRVAAMAALVILWRARRRGRARLQSHHDR